jgi:hypothetical protein
MSRIVSELIYQIKTDSAQFVKGMEEAKKKSEALSKSFTTAGKALTVGLTAPLVAAGAGMIKLAVEAGKTADRILDLEQITGLSTDTLQEFKNVAAVAGVDFEGLVGTLTRFQGRLKLIDQEGTASAEAVKRLGVSVRDANGELRSADDLFPEFIGALNQIEDITERNSIAQEVFGRSLQDLGPVLGLTAEQIKNAREEARELGIVQSKDALIAANNFRIEVDKLKLSLQGQAQALGQELIPVIQSFLPIVADTLKAVIGLTKGFTDLPVESQKTIIAIAGIAAALGPVLIAIGQLITLLPQLKAGFALLTGPGALGALSVGAPIVLGLAAVAATVAIIAKNTSDAKNQQLRYNQAIAGQLSLQETQAVLEQKRKEIQLENNRLAELERQQGRQGVAQAIINQKQVIAGLQGEAQELSSIITGYQRQQAEVNRLAVIKDAADKAAAEAALKAQLAQDAESIRLAGLAKQQADAADKALEDAKAKEDAEAEAIAQAAKNNQLRLDFADEESKVQREAAARYLAILNAEEAEKKKQHAAELARIEAEKQARIQAAQFAFNQVLVIARQLLDNELELLNQKSDAEKRILNKNLNGIKSKYESEKKAIEDSTLDEETKAERIAALKENEKEQSEEVINKIADLEKQKEREAAIIKRKQAEFDRANSLVAIASNTARAVSAALEIAPPLGYILAGVNAALGAAQAAAVLAKPLPPIPSFAQGTRNFMVPPGFPNDSFPIMVQSGERVTVETPQQQAGGGGEGNVFQIGTVIADPAGLRELDRLLRKYGTIENIRRG